MSTLQVDRIIPYQSSSVLVEGLSAPNLATTGSNTFVGDQDIQGTITASIQEGFALVGGVGDVSTLVATSSFGGVVDTSSLATTGSNTFTGNQTITGSLTISGSDNFDLTVIGFVRVTGSLDGQNVGVTNSSISVNSGSTNGSITALGVNFGNGGSIQNRIALYSNPTLANTGVSSTNPSIIVNKSTPPFPVHAVEFIDGATISLKLPTQITGSLTISGSSAVDLTVVGNQTVSGSVLVSGSVTQRFNAPAENTVTELISVNGASIGGTPYNFTQFTFTDFDFGIDTYRDAFIIESWDSDSFVFGSEFVLNGKNALLTSFASGSVSGDNRGGQVGLFDQGNGKTKAILTGQNIEIGGVGKSAFNSLISETITIGRTGIQTVVSGSVGIEKALTLAPQDPLPANGVGQLAVSGSNLYYNNGSTWTQIN
jgi:hypothetical protein